MDSELICFRPQAAEKLIFFGSPLTVNEAQKVRADGLPFVDQGAIPALRHGCFHFINSLYK